MNQINKLTVLLSSLALLAALLMSIPTRAEACGSYGPPTEEEQVSRALYEVFWSQQQEQGRSSNEWLVIDAIDVTAGRVAVVQAHTRYDDTTLGPKLQFALYNVGDAWEVASRPSMALLVTSLKHALDANIKATLNQSHNAIKLSTVDSQRVLHSLASVAK